VSTYAGTYAGAGFADGGPGAGVYFNNPHGVVVADGGAVVVVDTGNHRVRVVSPGRVVSTLAGGGSAGGTASGAADGSGTAATFYGPTGVAVDRVSGVYYVVDTGNHRVRRVAAGSGAVSTLAGGNAAGTFGSNCVPPGGYYTPCGYVNGVGTGASFYAPYGAALHAPTGLLYVGDTNNNVVRVVDTASGAVSTLAGGGSAGGRAGGWADGTGTGALFGSPYGVALHPSGGVLFVADWDYGVIRVINTATRAVSTLAGSGSVGTADGVGAGAYFQNPCGLAVDLSGAYVFVTDRNIGLLRRVTVATGAVATLAGNPAGGQFGGYADGRGTAALFSSPRGVAVDPAAPGGTLYVADQFNHLVRAVKVTRPAAMPSPTATNSPSPSARPSQ
jgi:DNA-binding beta-propeller fold protein YncE